MTVVQAATAVCHIFGKRNTLELPSHVRMGDLLTALNASIQECFTRAPKALTRIERSTTISLSTEVIAMNAADTALLGPVWLESSSGALHVLREIASREEWQKLKGYVITGLGSGGAGLLPAAFFQSSDTTTGAADLFSTRVIRIWPVLTAGGTFSLRWIARIKAPSFTAVHSATAIPVPNNYAEIAYLPILRWHCARSRYAAPETLANMARIQADYQEALVMLEELNSGNSIRRDVEHRGEITGEAGVDRLERSQ